ncbi:MAG: excisionase family DNA-binding protein [Thermoguttaceae bacterium]|nr:excisionase family DNA-binding protein [Thermoguttaceae bacterium]
MNRIERAARRPDFLTFDETAQLLRTSKPTLRKWIQRGLVPGKKVGRNQPIPRDLRRGRQARRFGKVRRRGITSLRQQQM